MAEALRPHGRKKVVPTEIAEAKIRAACSERLNPETWILARTDARAVYDLDEAMRRASAMSGPAPTASSSRRRAASRSCSASAKPSTFRRSATR